MTPSDSLPPSLSSLIAEARAHDGAPPFSDGSLVELAQGQRELVWQTDAAAALYKEGEAELVVAPHSRRHGLGAQLLAQLVERSAGPLLVWAHGDLPGAVALAARFGFTPVRTLLKLRAPLMRLDRPFATRDAGAKGRSRRIRAFRPEDTDEWVALNARAFAAHPEQGAVTAADLEVTRREPWYSDDDFLLLRDADGVLVAYCWLKVENADGEIYVLGVEPARQGEGWGRAAMEAGFARLRELGIREAHLYVEGDNVPALRLYHSLGFTEAAVDVQYRWEPEVPQNGGNMGAVSRVGATVRRESGDWTPTVHALLSHLRDRGVDGVPEPLGIDAHGREVLGFLDGEVPQYPLPEYVWSESALRDAARTLRVVHDASVGFTGTGWRQPPREPAEVICHNDFAPYNFVFRDGELAGVIDWDYAAPGPRVWDLAYLAYRLVPLTEGQRDEERLRILLEEYGTGITIDELIPAVVARLEALAVFSDEQSQKRSNPELAEHAALYRADAENLRG